MRLTATDDRLDMGCGISGRASSWIFVASECWQDCCCWYSTLIFTTLHSYRYALNLDISAVVTLSVQFRSTCFKLQFALRTGIDVNDPTVQLASIIMELEDGCVERVQMSDDESAEEVAKKVCRKNDLPDQFVALLAKHIMDRYPQRPVDKPKEEVTVNSEETKESKTVKSPIESSNSRESNEK